MRFMTGKAFVDTNVLIYLFSKTEPNKRMVIAELLHQTGQIVWSTQVIQKFYQVMTAKHGKEPQKVKSIIQQFGHFELIVINLETINQAIDIQFINNLSFWDSLIISAAYQANCTSLITEDLTHLQNISGVRIFNPFH